MEVPQKLYHYTTVNTLALILQSQSILFNRADKVNDKREGLSSDFGSMAQYIFLSCWTETKEEDLSLWNMYTPQMRGVRIEFPMPIFETYQIDDIYTTIIPSDKIEDIERKIFILPHKDLVYKVEYTDDQELLTPKIITTLDKYEGLRLTDIGTRKKTMWQVENEWRFRLNIFPIDVSLDTAFYPDRYYKLVESRIAPPIENYLVKVNGKSFRQMKIRLGPKMNSGDEEIVKALIAIYNPTAEFGYSDLTGDIR